jgi:hypothetical protein
MPAEFFPYDQNDKEKQNEKQKLLKEVSDFLEGPLAPGLLPKILDYLYKMLKKGLYFTKEFAILSDLADKYLREMNKKRKEQQTPANFTNVVPNDLYNIEGLNKLIETLTQDAEELYTELVTKGLDDITEQDLQKVNDYINKLDSYNLSSSLAYIKLTVLYFKVIMYKLKNKRNKEEE